MRRPDDIPPEMLLQNANNDMLLFTALLSIIIGFILIWLGKKGQQLWLLTWSVGLVICSVLLGGYMLLYAP